MERRIWKNVGLEDLPVFAAEIVQWLKQAPPVWRFDGEMGAGKTTLIKLLCQQLEVMDVVHSPTFGLVNEYLTQGGEPIYHFDFYRIENPEEAVSIGVSEYFDSGALCLIEWPERVDALLPDEYVQLQLMPQPDNSRTIEVTIHGTTQ